MKKVNNSDAAEILGVAPHTLSNWRIRGDGPRFLKIGGKVYYPVAEIEAFLRRSLRSSTSDRGEEVGT